MVETNRLGLTQAYYLGKILHDLSMALQYKERFNVRGNNGLIDCIYFIKDNLKLLNICHDIQLEIEGQVNYLTMLYIEQLDASLYLNVYDREIFKEKIEKWTSHIFNSLKTDFYEPIKIGSCPTIFIGHGHNSWKELVEHLRYVQCFKVETYESEERSGHIVPKIIEKMIRKSSIAFLVFTGEIEEKDGKFHARDNVIHELGFCHNNLGLERSIVLMEKGVSLPSNIQGIQRIQFDKDAISEIFGNIVGVIRREFTPLAYNDCV